MSTFSEREREGGGRDIERGEGRWGRRETVVGERGKRRQKRERRRRERGDACHPSCSIATEASQD
jgi:hypothetical protein